MVPGCCCLQFHLRNSSCRKVCRSTWDQASGHMMLFVLIVCYFEWYVFHARIFVYFSAGVCLAAASSHSVATATRTSRTAVPSAIRGLEHTTVCDRLLASTTTYPNVVFFYTFLTPRLNPPPPLSLSPSSDTTIQLLYETFNIFIQTLWLLSCGGCFSIASRAAKHDKKEGVSGIRVGSSYRLFQYSFWMEINCMKVDKKAFLLPISETTTLATGHNKEETNGKCHIIQRPRWQATLLQYISWKWRWFGSL